MRKKVQPVLIRMDREKYLAVRHRLIDEGVSVSAFVNRLIEEHIEGAEIKRRRSQEPSPEIKTQNAHRIRPGTCKN